jgi:HK97 family phage portal protein
MNLWNRFAGAAKRAASRAWNLVSSGDREGMLALFGSMLSASGEPITDKTAMLVSTVYACVTKIAGTISQLPINIYTYDGKGDRTLVRDSALWWLLNESPSAEWTASSWKEFIVYCVLLRGDQHTEILRSGPRIVGLRVHHPDKVRPVRKNGRLIYYVSWCPGEGQGEEYYGVDQDDMLHFCGFGFDGTKSMSVIQWAARNAIGNALTAAKYSGTSLASGGNPQVVLKYPKALNADQRKDLRNSYNETYGDPTAKKIPLVLSEGGDVSALSISPVDLDLIAQRKFEKEDICQAMGVPPVLIGENDKTSSWGTGIEQITLGFVKFTIMPHVGRWEEEKNRKLYRRAGTFLEYDMEALLRGDAKSQAEALRAALGGPGTGDGWMSVNEVRRLKNLGPVAGGNEPFRAQRDTGGKPAAEPEPKPAKGDSNEPQAASASA